MARPQTATPERILSAALQRFSAYGFKRTSMDDIATEAGVSRAALYLQFKNKEEIFRSLARELQDEALARARAAIRPDAPLAETLQAVFEARSVRFLQIASASPHGAELLDETSRLCGDLAAAMQHRFQALVTELVRGAVRRGDVDLAAVELSAPAAADLLCRAVAGLKGPAVTVAVYRDRLASLVRVFVAGLRPFGAARISGRRRGRASRPARR